MVTATIVSGRWRYSKRVKTLAIVGIGYWGKNLIRVFSKIAEIKVCVHTGNSKNKQWLKRNFPSTSITTDYESALNDPEIDAIIIATPIRTHYKLTRQALLSEKHVFVEKPLATTVDQAKELKSISEENCLSLFVGYIFCHHPTLQPVYNRAENQSIKWARFSWNKLGEFGRDIFLDLVGHPVAIALQLFSAYPDRIHLVDTYGVENDIDIVSIRMYFPGGCIFDIMINRLSPRSQKSLQILLEDNLFFWTEEGLYKFYDTEFELVSETNEEPLLAEAKQFISEIDQDSVQQSSSELGYNVNQIIQQLRENNN